jgi:ssDNA-binding Zn-finger/Zn-ribbon topoisomerase 1
MVKAITCAVCGKQQTYKLKRGRRGFARVPHRCPDCRYEPDVRTSAWEPVHVEQVEPPAS